MALTNLNMKAKAIAAGLEHYLAIGDDGALYSWGLNNYGQLGLGDLDNRMIPTKVGSKTDWISVSCGDYHSIAMDSNDNIYGFGRNTNREAATTSNFREVEPYKWDRWWNFNSRPELDPNPDNKMIKAIAKGSMTLVHHPAFFSSSPGTVLQPNQKEGVSIFGTCIENIFDNESQFSAFELPEYFDSPELMDLSTYSFVFTKSATPGIFIAGKQPDLNPAGYNGHIVDADLPADDYGYTSITTSYPKALVIAHPDFVSSNFTQEVTNDRISMTDTNFYTDIGVGDNFILGIDRDGRLWGATLAITTSNANTPVGNFGWVFRRNGPGINFSTFVNGLELLDDSRTWFQVSCGKNHAFVSDIDGNVFSFGNNQYGQLGRNYSNTGNDTVLTQLDPPADSTGWKFHACGERTTLLIQE